MTAFRQRDVATRLWFKGQSERDRVWAGLTANGGEEGHCGWCKDRFGFSSQIAPRQLGAWMKSASAPHMIAAFMPITKLDIATWDHADQAGAAS
ncbi:MAG: VOC family protein [Caulobacterales bacterium]|jgi:predicted 3-demethylubiquinone-9 3-methyltransferase (glyoxalase superfamily)